MHIPSFSLITGFANQFREKVDDKKKLFFSRLYFWKIKNWNCHRIFK